MSNSKVTVLERHVRTLLEGLGEDLSRDGLLDTPKRVAKAYLDSAAGYRTSAESVIQSAVFSEEMVTKGSGGLILVRNITFSATCRRTLMPFHGECHVAYIPSEPRVLGLSKAARLVDAYAKRVVTQQELADSLVTGISLNMPCRGVSVVVHARHLGSASSQLVSTAATCGCFSTPQSTQQQEVDLLLRMVGAGAPTTLPHLPAHIKLPPSLDLPARASMVSAVQSIYATLLQDTADTITPAAAAAYVDTLTRQTVGQRTTLEQVHRARLAPTGAAPSAPHAACSGPDSGDACDGAGADASDTSTVTSGAADPVSSCPSRCMETSSESDADEHTPRAASARWRMHGEAGVQSCEVPIQRERAPDARSVDVHGVDTATVWRAQFSSQCEHHLLPFYGTLYIAVHSPQGRPSPALDPALVQDLVNLYSRRLQIQERITHEVAEAVQALCGPDDSLMVVCDSAHMCMVARGVEKHASSSVTSAARGAFEVDKRLQMGVLEQIVDATQAPGGCACR